ncbi:nucleoside hydrolase [Kriegella aquimaris]|uniref:Inosine-uridine nucleoside N-ribohydrolase n=1 Tax=Kriegella aquimaris TaxID=192904 RepID=A0A1G9V5C3_9FLAO|nr:nucleoside hydrolase [Kriegella aquimaris]SDM67372.1 Inosine-uridine nucleoside N-ribohydrolase [Kriegella aquimaris]
MNTKISFYKVIQRFKHLSDWSLNQEKLRVRQCLVYFAFVLFIGLGNVYSQDMPKLSEELRLHRLAPATGKINVVIDTDTYNEIDDQFAVVYALLSPEQMKVQAIYAAPYLNNRSVSPRDGMQKSHEEILRLMEKLGINPKGLVHKGSEDFLKDYTQPLQSDAAKDLIKKAMASEGPLYVLTLGAPTNVASAILLEPKIINKIVVVWLGGKGLDWKTAYEFNLKQDLLSSKVLFDSGVPLIQLPTEPVTSHLQTTIPELETYLKGQGAIGDYLIDIFKAYHKDHYAYSKIIWDISAIAYAVNPSWFQSEIRHAPILTDQITYSFDNSRHFYRTVTFLNRDKIFGDMFRKIQQHQK